MNIVKQLVHPFEMPVQTRARSQALGELSFVRGADRPRSARCPATETFERLYDRFNARDMDAALATMHRDVVWANGLEGGHVLGHDGVRGYWTRQWATVDSQAKPLRFSIGADGTVDVDVHLTARDRNGNVLFDSMGVHVFRIENGLIRRFDIRS